MKMFLLALFTALFAFGSHAQADETEPITSPKDEWQLPALPEPGLIICVGDSHTVGVGSSQRDHSLGWVADLDRELAFVSSGWRTKNMGVSGITLMYLKGVINRSGIHNALPTIRLQRPRVVFIMLGTNDAQRKYAFYYSQYFFQQYADFIDDVKKVVVGRDGDGNEVHPYIIVCTPPPMNPVLHDKSREDGLRDMLPKIRALAEEKQVDLLDLHELIPSDGVYALDADCFGTDPWHMNNHGHRLLADAAFKKITGAEFVGPRPMPVSAVKIW